MPLVKHVNREEFQYIVNYLFVMLGYPELRRTMWQTFVQLLKRERRKLCFPVPSESFHAARRVCGDVFIYA